MIREIDAYLACACLLGANVCWVAILVRGMRRQRTRAMRVWLRIAE